MTGKSVRIMVAAALAAGALAGCTAQGRTEGGGGKTAAAPATPSGRTIPFDLYTHCGIDEARVGSTYFEAVTPLSDGSGNPPAGWGNPSQHGTMTMTSGSEAVFTDTAGHTVTFRARPGATAFKHLCS